MCASVKVFLAFVFSLAVLCSGAAGYLNASGQYGFEILAIIEAACNGFLFIACILAYSSSQEESEELTTASA